MGYKVSSAYENKPRWDVFIGVLFLIFCFVYTGGFRDYLLLFATKKSEFYHHQYRVSSFWVPGDKLIRESIYFKVSTGDKKFYLHLYPEDFRSDVFRLMGVADVVVGDESFDKAFVIRTNNKDLVKRILSPQIRAALVQRLYYIPEIQLRSGVLTYRKKMEYSFQDERESERRVFNDILDVFVGSNQVMK